jgi:hypothetical protein
MPIDHVGFVSADLAALREAFMRLGFNLTEAKPLFGRDGDGNDVPLGQLSCHAVFERGYIELTAPTGENPDNHLYPYLSRYSGLHILALASDDTAVAHGELQAAGLVAPASVVNTASRKIAYGSRHGEAGFRWFMLDPERFTEGLVCVVEHRTPDLVYQREVQDHPNTAQALVGSTLVSHAPETSRRYRDAAAKLNMSAPHVHPRSSLCISEHDVPLSRAIERDHLAGIDVLVRSLNAARGYDGKLADDPDSVTYAVSGCEAFVRFLTHPRRQA